VPSSSSTYGIEIGRLGRINSPNNSQAQYSCRLPSGSTAVRERVVIPHLINAVFGETRPSRPLAVPVVRHGAVVHSPAPVEVRAHHRRAKAQLLPLDLDLTPGPPRLTGAFASRHSW
jgi:nicotinate phosphoribosyltransferase